LATLAFDQIKMTFHQKRKTNAVYQPEPSGNNKYIKNFLFKLIVAIKLLTLAL